MICVSRKPHLVATVTKCRGCKAPAASYWGLLGHDLQATLVFADGNYRTSFTPYSFRYQYHCYSSSEAEARNSERKCVKTPLLLGSLVRRPAVVYDINMLVTPHSRGRPTQTSPLGKKFRAVHDVGEQGRLKLPP